MAIDTIKSTAVLDGSITSDDLSYPLTGFSSTGIDDNADATSITIDSSENVLVGLSAEEAVGTNAGTQLRANGLVYAAVTSDAHILSRRSTDGAILNFRKDTTTVGNIGTTGGRLKIGSTSAAGLRFDGAQLIPFVGASESDNAVDLGWSTSRFRDAYIGGGVYLGGTVAANKLDDYEEGTWTPTVVVGSLTAGNAWYIRVGDMVTIAANCYNFGDRSSSQPVGIKDVPFSNGSRASVGSFMGAHISSSVGYSSYIAGNDNKIYFYEAPNSGNYETMKHNDLQTNADFYFCITYRV